MSIHSFLQQLASTGSVLVGRELTAPGEDLDPEERAALLQLLGELHLRQSLELAGDAPEFAPDAALWATAWLHRATVFLVHHDLDADVVAAALAVTYSFERSAATILAVDLVFRWLPDLARLCAGFSSEDPLVVALRCAGREWPLSSVGMPELGLPDSATALDIALIEAHPALWQLYLDRVVAHADASRLEDAATRDALVASAGMYPELTGKLV